MLRTEGGNDHSGSPLQQSEERREKCRLEGGECVAWNVPDVDFITASCFKDVILIYFKTCIAILYHKPLRRFETEIFQFQYIAYIDYLKIHISQGLQWDWRCSVPKRSNASNEHTLETLAKR